MAKTVNISDMLIEAQGRQCPIQMHLEFLGSVNEVAPLDQIQARWTISYDAGPNKLNLTTLSTIQSTVTGQWIQIPHSNLHACQFGPRPCTPFDRGESPRDNTINQEVNFTSGNKAEYQENDLRFPGGLYSVLAAYCPPWRRQLDAL